MKYINSIIIRNIVPYSYFPHILFLNVLYIQLHNFKYINCIINCNIVPYSYFPHILALHILYIQLQTVKCINCIINCNILPYSYFPHVLSQCILYTFIHSLNYIKPLPSLTLPCRPKPSKRSCCPLRNSVACCERNRNSLLPDVMKSLSEHVKLGC